MRKLFATIFEKIRSRLDAFAEDTAEALENGDQQHLFRNAALALMTVLGTLGSIALLLTLLYAGRKILLPLVIPPLVIAVLIASYFETRKDDRMVYFQQEEKALLEERAERLYEYVRDGIFLVLRAVSEYTPIVRPSTPSSIETNAQFYIRDGVAVFQFNALLSDAVEISQLKRDMERILGQKLRAHELPGLPTKLVTLHGRTYAPVQILNIVDIGSSVNIDVVLTNEKSILLVEANRRLQLERKSHTKGSPPFDNEF